MKIEEGKDYLLIVKAEDTQGIEESDCLQVSIKNHSERFTMHKNQLIDPASLQAESYEEGEIVEVMSDPKGNWCKARYMSVRTPHHAKSHYTAQEFFNHEEIRKLPKPSKTAYDLTGEEIEHIESRRKEG